MTTINSITKKDGEVLEVGDNTNFGRIKFFRDFMGEMYAAFHEHPNQYKVEDVSKKGVGDGFIWTDELVKEFAELYTNEIFSNKVLALSGRSDEISFTSIDYFIKSKQSQSTKRKPLFRTEDGVDVFDNDTYWKVFNGVSTIRYNATIGGFYPISYTKTTFSTKESAEAYVAKQSATKPPLGIVPMWLWQEQRLDDINDAIKRYFDAGKEIPKEWIAESASHAARLQTEEYSKYKKQSTPPKEENKRDWEIVECYTNDINITHDFIPENNTIGSTGCFKMEEPCKIKSVRRLSDGEVFGVGERYINMLGEKDTIRGIEIYGDRIRIHSDKAGYCEFSMIKNSKPKENKERIEVTGLSFYGSTDTGNSYWFNVAGNGRNYRYEIPKEKFLSIKKAIEAVLNNETTFTQSQMDKAIEKAFFAARELDQADYHHPPYKHKTLMGYIKTIKQ